MTLDALADHSHRASPGWWVWGGHGVGPSQAGLGVSVRLQVCGTGCWAPQK